MYERETIGLVLFNKPCLCLSLYFKKPRSSDARNRSCGRNYREAVQRIVADLESDGYIEIRKQGRRNTYIPKKEDRLKHPIETNCLTSKLLQTLANVR